MGSRPEEHVRRHGILVAGNLFAGVYKDRLLVRVSSDDGDALLGEPDVAAFDMMPRPMPGWITVGQSPLNGDGLVTWLLRGREYALTLPAK